MSISLITKFQPYVDELFSTESKHELFTTKEPFSFVGAHTVKIYKVSTAQMNDYGRAGAAEGNWSRYGEVESLDATTEELTVSQDRSFTFAIDALDEQESEAKAAAALARQLREVVVPEIDGYVISTMATNAGTKATAAELTAANIYSKIIAGTEALDAAEVPESERVLIVTPAVFSLLKQSPNIFDNDPLSAEMRAKGVIGMIDGLQVIRVPASRVPDNFGFIIAWKGATIAPVKLADYRTHINPPGLNGALVEGRVVYDSFVLDNKANGIYYQAVTDDVHIKAAAYDVTAPVKSATRQTTHDGGTGYTAAIAWSPNAGTTFAAETAYTATVTLTAADGYIFNDDFDAADVIGLPATSGGGATASEVTVTRVSNTSVKIVVKYLATAA